MTRFVAATVLVHLAATPALVTRDAFLMGTRAQLSTYAESRAAGLDRLEAALRLLDATERELSTWRDDSIISALNRLPVGQPQKLPDATCRLLRAVFGWSRFTGGTFDATLGQPDAFALGNDCVITRAGAAALDVGAFGKGAALDRVGAAIGPGPWLIDLGGQVTVGGPKPDDQPWVIDVAHPTRRDEAFLQVSLREGSLSTSGNSERGRHIIDPRTGRPAAFSGSVTVWHESALVADVLSTALYVMGPEAGVEWAGQRDIAAIYLVPDGAAVRRRETARWTGLR